ncbi:DNA-binding PadR family transcriptional regulator [Streptosporangium album]|uniref:DNA-binding PadR family transcriptional regulator n=1 Tax=Streptosporangium album TaxID=47479 RepID=A0A7W7W8A5_9ACTN|nr:PadR family transcriptional regulator [Streptosporangium album]MBB4936780.1 DNA-binding PadR family transcriptional regulator [Streptosporangium album]
MEKRRKVANPLALAVLAELLMEPLHPYEMGRRLKEHGRDRNIKYTRGSLYMVVEQLEKAGFVTEHDTIRDTQRPERTLYRLTDEGRDELYDWMRDLVADPRHEYPHFGVALSLLAVLPPEESAGLLNRRLVALTDERDRLRAAVQAAAEAGVLWVFLVDDEYRIATLDTEHRFVTGLIASIQQPDYVRAWQEFFGRQI